MNPFTTNRQQLEAVDDEEKEAIKRIKEIEKIQKLEKIILIVLLITFLAMSIVAHLMGEWYAR